MRTGLIKLTMRSVPPPPPPPPPHPFFTSSFFFLRRLTPKFASAKTNGIEKYGENLEKMKLNGPGKRKLRQEANYGTD